MLFSRPSFRCSWETKAWPTLDLSDACCGSESSERTVCSVHDFLVATYLDENGCLGQVQQQLHYSYLILAGLQSFNHLNRKKDQFTMTSLIPHMFTESLLATEGQGRSEKQTACVAIWKASENRWYLGCTQVQTSGQEQMNWNLLRCHICMPQGYRHWLNCGLGQGWHFGKWNTTYWNDLSSWLLLVI